MLTARFAVSPTRLVAPSPLRVYRPQPSRDKRVGMVRGLDRRSFIASAAAATGALTLPARLAAQPLTVDADGARILEVARREVARAGNALWRRDIAGVADFSLRSSEPRLYFANLEAGTVQSYLVAHGLGSDPEHDGWLHWFSNEPGSNATSRGSYITYDWYKGKYGMSIRLGGLDPDNSNALDRAIVMHSAEYATPQFVAEHGVLGRSNGCFAMAPSDFMFALTQLSGGRLIFADKITPA